MDPKRNPGVLISIIDMIFIHLLVEARVLAETCYLYWVQRNNPLVHYF